MCPFRLVNSFLAFWVRGGQFFVHEDGSIVTRFQFSALFKLCLSAVGVQASEYGLHSFRIGAATKAVRAGLSGHVAGEVAIPVLCGLPYVHPELMD